MLNLRRIGRSIQLQTILVGMNQGYNEQNPCHTIRDMVSPRDLRVDIKELTSGMARYPSC